MRDVAAALKNLRKRSGNRRAAHPERPRTGRNRRAERCAVSRLARSPARAPRQAPRILMRRSQQPRTPTPSPVPPANWRIRGSAPGFARDRRFGRLGPQSARVCPRCPPCFRSGASRVNTPQTVHEEPRSNDLATCECIPKPLRPANILSAHGAGSAAPRALGNRPPSQLAEIVWFRYDESPARLAQPPSRKASCRAEYQCSDLKQQESRTANVSSPH